MKRKRKPEDVVAWVRVKDEYLGLGESLSQAVQALEIASELAVARGSSEDLTNAAHGWMRVTETIHGLNNAADQKAESESWGRPSATEFGFRAPEPAKIDGEDPIAEEEDVD